MSESPKLKLRPPPGTRPAREKTCWQCGQTYVTSLEFCPEDGARLVELTLDEDHDPLLNQTIGGRYEVRERLGEGGMGTVYRARDPQQNIDVAIKVLKADYLRDETIRRRFMHEARTIASLEHPNAVKFHDFGQMPDGNFYMVMELLVGESLADRLAYKFLTYGEIFNIIPPICEVLAEAHERGVVHRDLKPENIFITTDEQGREVARLIDFGVAKQLQRQTLTQTGAMWGTPAYMSPEQARGDVVGAQADTYAMGIILFELVCGHLPFQANTQMGYAIKHMHQPARAMRSVPGLTSPPEALDALVYASLSKDPAQRPASMAEVAAELRRIASAFLDERAAAHVPAQEIDTQQLEQWVRDGDAQLPEDVHLPSNERAPRVTSRQGLISGTDEARVETAWIGPVEEDEVVMPTRDLRPIYGLAAGGVLLLVILIVAAAVSSEEVDVSAEPSPEAVIAAEDAETSAASAAPTEGTAPASEFDGAAAGLAASGAARVVIRAQALTQAIASSSRAADAAPSANTARRKAPRRVKKRPRANTRPRESDRRDNLKNALRKTF